MHPRELLYQPVNLAISILFVLSFGLVTTSMALKSAGMADPVTGFGEYVGGKMLDAIFGPIVIPRDYYNAPLDTKCRC